MDEISKAIKGARDAQRGRIYGSFSNAQQVSSDDDSIQKSNEEEIIKGGKKAVVGEIREWSGKRYRKQANGKWLEVSKAHNMSKEEHLQFSRNEYQRAKQLKEREMLSVDVFMEVSLMLNKLVRMTIQSERVMKKKSSKEGRKQ